MSNIEKQLIEYKKKKANILGPNINIEELSQFHKIIIDSVMLSVDPVEGDVYKYKDTFKGNPAQFIITGKGLQKLAVCAGIVWNPAFTKVTSISHKYVAYMATGCIRKADGQQVCYQAESDVDIDVVIDEIQEQFRQKKKKWAGDQWFKKMGTEGQIDYIESAMTKEINYRKKHKTKIAATDARSRVIRPLLMLQKTYTDEELGRPFVSPRVILSPDYSDPSVKKMMLAAAIQAQTNIFGQAPSQLVDESPIEILPCDYHEMPPNEADVPEQPPEDKPQDEAVAEKDKPEKETEKKPAEDDSPELKKFWELSENGQIRELTNKAKVKGYDLDSLPTKLSEMDSRNRDRFFTHLFGMSDAASDAGAEIPF